MNGPTMFKGRYKLQLAKDHVLLQVVLFSRFLLLVLRGYLTVTLLGLRFQVFFFCRTYIYFLQGGSSPENVEPPSLIEKNTPVDPV